MRDEILKRVYSLGKKHGRQEEYMQSDFCSDSEEDEILKNINDDIEDFKVEHGIILSFNDD